MNEYNIEDYIKKIKSLEEIVKLKNEEILAIKQKLDLNDKMSTLGLLAGGISHDFNNQLQIIFGYSELLLTKVSENSKEREWLQAIIEATQTAEGITRNLRSFARQDEFYFEQLDLDLIIRTTCNMMKRSIIKKDIRLNYENMAKNVYVKADSSAIKNDLINLINNSVYAIKNNGIINITLSNHEFHGETCHICGEIMKGNYLAIEVSDNGHGISKENIKKIFQPFFTTKPVGEGTGIGLAAVLGRVHQHKGHINVSSEVNIGTKFTIYIPESLAPHNNKEKDALAYGLGDILVIDDEKQVSAVVRESLEGLGYRVLVANDGLQGVNQFFKYHRSLDLVLLDMIMPIMDGKEAFFKINKINSKVPVVIMTGHYTDSVEELRNHGVIEILKKPVLISDLSKIIDNIIGIKHKQKHERKIQLLINEFSNIDENEIRKFYNEMKLKQIKASNIAHFLDEITYKETRSLLMQETNKI